MYKPVKPGVDTLFLKFRPSCIKIGDLIYKALPAGRTMFLYRNAETWARSASRSIQTLVEERPKVDAVAADPYIEFLSRLDISKPHEPAARSAPPRKHGQPSEAGKFADRASPLVRDYIKRAVKRQLTGRDKVTLLWLMVAQRLPVLKNHSPAPLDYLQPYIDAIPPMKLLTLVWLSSIQGYLAMHAQGIPMLAVQYETLIADPEAALRAILAYCGLPEDQAAVAAGAFAEDSQKDTPLAWGKVGRATRGVLAPELVEQLREVLREHPPIQTPDFVVPNSLLLHQDERAGR
jgi:hypothetical protein